MMLSPSLKESLFQATKDAPRFLVAFSGGPDSVFLLLALNTLYPEDLPSRAAIAYVDYQDSPWVDQEEKTVRHYASLFHLPLFRMVVRADAERKDHNFEDWARNVRYQYFADLGKEHGFQAVLTAHQENDDIETFVLQKKRGNLPRHYGLSEESRLYGFPVRRPLLSVSREEILRTLQEEKAVFYDDKTNQNLNHERNRVRFKGFTPEEKAGLLKEKDRKNQELDSLQRRFQSFDDFTSFDCYSSLTEEEKRRYLFYRLDAFPWTENLESSAAQKAYVFLTAQRSGCLPLSSSCVCYRTRDGFFFFLDTRKLHYEFSFDSSLPVTLSTSVFRFQGRAGLLPSKGEWTLRSFRPGDRMETSLPEKDVYRFLRKQSVPSYLLPLYPVFVWNGKIQRVPFYRDLLSSSFPFRFRLPPFERKRLNLSERITLE